MYPVYLHGMRSEKMHHQHERDPELLMVPQMFDAEILLLSQMTSSAKLFRFGQRSPRYFCLPFRTMSEEREIAPMSPVRARKGMASAIANTILIRALLAYVVPVVCKVDGSVVVALVSSVVSARPQG
jgi:hypothetical protein